MDSLASKWIGTAKYTKRTPAQIKKAREARARHLRALDAQARFEGRIR